MRGSQACCFVLIFNGSGLYETFGLRLNYELLEMAVAPSKIALKAEIT